MSLAGLFASGLVVDVIIGVIALEAVWILSRKEGRAAPLSLLLALAPGVCLLLALRAALIGADWRWIALALAASFPIHLLDLRRRLRRR